MEGNRKPLAKLRESLSKVEGRRRMRLSGVTIAWRGTPNLDDWVAYIATGTRSKKLILADHASERKVRNLLARLQTLSREEVQAVAVNATPSAALSAPRLRSARSKVTEVSERASKITAFAKEVIRLREHGLDDWLIARATGDRAATVKDWRDGHGEPTGAHAERIAELAAIVERLRRLLQPEYVPVWLTKPIAALDDEKPIDVVSRGDAVQVARLISGLEDSGAA